VVGPGYAAIAQQYKNQGGAEDKLAAKILEGGGGMTPHPDFTYQERRAMAEWVLSQISATSATSGREIKTYKYTRKDGTTVSLDFSLFLDNQSRKVTKEVFHGYQLYNSYCYRCHGTDANDSQLAPDLRHSVNAGMSQSGFLSVAMTGKKETGMPSWAGFLSEDDVIHIYRYVKGRSLDLIAPGRPPSAQD
jgi:cytochrome c